MVKVFGNLAGELSCFQPFQLLSAAAEVPVLLGSPPVKFFNSFEGSCKTSAALVFGIATP